MNPLGLAATPKAADEIRDLPSMSARRLLRGALPPVYRDGRTVGEEETFAERWLEACEQVLDPVLALLDNLPAHLDPALAPPDLLDLLGHWVGMDWPPRLGVPARRRMLAHATRLAKCRGTQAGLELAFELAVPELPLRVTHTGVITTSTDPSAPAPALEPRIDVTCSIELDPDARAVVRALIEDQRPAHASYRLIDGPGSRS